MKRRTILNIIKTDSFKEKKTFSFNLLLLLVFRILHLNLYCWIVQILSNTLNYENNKKIQSIHIIHKSKMYRRNVFSCL